MGWEWGWITVAFGVSYYMINIFWFFFKDKGNGLNKRLKFFLITLSLAFGLTAGNALMGYLFSYMFPVPILRTIVFVPVLVSSYYLFKYVDR